MNFQELLNDSNYLFLKTEFENNPIQYLTFSGSISYGTNNENSDVDIRGLYLENIDELLTIKKTRTNFINEKTDTVLYSLREFCKLLSDCNPNILELMGVNEEHIIYETDIIKSLKENLYLFLNKHAYFTFIGYANQQLRRLQNALAHDIYNKEKHILKTIQYELSRTENDFKLLNSNNECNLYIDNNEIVTDLNLKHISFRELANRINQLQATVKNFDKLNHRNRKKDDNHLNKHAMHLIRLLFTGIDVLQYGIIKTYRSNELSLLKDIRNGLVPYEDIFKLAESLEIKIKKIYENSKLPDKPNYDQINEWLKNIYINYYFRRNNNE